MFPYGLVETIIVRLLVITDTACFKLRDYLNQRWLIVRLLATSSSDIFTKYDKKNYLMHMCLKMSSENFGHFVQTSMS